MMYIMYKDDSLSNKIQALYKCKINTFCVYYFSKLCVYFKVTNFLKGEHKLSETLVLSQLKLSILFGDESYQLSFSKTYLEMQLPPVEHTPFSNKLVLSV